MAPPSISLTPPPLSAILESRAVSRRYACVSASLTGGGNRDIVVDPPGAAASRRPPKHPLLKPMFHQALCAIQAFSFLAFESSLTLRPAIRPATIFIVHGPLIRPSVACSSEHQQDAAKSVPLFFMHHA